MFFVEFTWYFSSLESLISKGVWYREAFLAIDAIILFFEDLHALEYYFAVEISLMFNVR